MKISLFLIVFLSVYYSFSQKVNIYGTVKDTTGQALFGANIIVKQNGKIITYGTTDGEGKFSKNIPPGKNYSLKVSYIGYASLIRKIPILDKDTRFQIVLEESKTDLKEIVISIGLPDFIQKKDTLIYNLKALIDGSESNLKEMIQKLPGMSINDNGKVMYQGKQIDKVLINGNDFFNKQHQLATENITSDMVQGIEYYSKYKDEFDTRSDSPVQAMNVVLKEKYLGRITGNIIVAGGNDQRYKLHPNVFYFKKNTNLAFIGDVNNIAEQAISLNDYMELRGGVNNFIKGELRVGMHELNKENIPVFLLGDRKTKEESIIFGGLNMVVKKPKKLSFKGFYIYNLINNTKNIFSQRNYITGDVFSETKDLNGKYLIFNTASELKWKIDTKNNIGVLLTTDWQQNTGDGLINQDEQKLNYTEDYSYITLGAKIDYSHNFSNDDVLDFRALLEYKKDDKNLYMIGNYPILNSFFDTETYDFAQFAAIEKNKYSFTTTYSKFYDRFQFSWETGALFYKDKYTIDSDLDNIISRLNWKNRDYFAGMKIKYNGLSWHIKMKLDLRNSYLETLNENPGRHYTFLSPFISFNYLFSLFHNVSWGYYYGKISYASSKYLPSDYFMDVTKIVSNKRLIEDYYPSHNLFFNYANNIRKMKFYYSLNVNYNWKYNAIDLNLQQVSPTIVLYQNRLTPFLSNFSLMVSLHKNLFKHYNLGYDFYYTLQDKKSEDINDFQNTVSFHNIQFYSRLKHSAVNFSIGMKYSYFKATYGGNGSNLMEVYKPYIKLNGKINKKTNWRLQASYDKYSYLSEDYYFNINPSIEYILSKKIQLSLVGNNLTNLNSYKKTESISTLNYTEYQTQSMMPGYFLLQFKYAF